MADSLTPETLQALFDNGGINKSTYELGMSHLAPKDPTQDIVPDEVDIKKDATGPQDKLDQYKAFEKQNNINATPDEVERKAEDLTLADKQAEANAAGSQELKKQNQAMARTQQDVQYNQQAAKLGLPLRDIASSQPGQSPSGNSPEVVLPGSAAKVPDPYQSQMGEALQKQQQGFDMQQDAAVQGGAAGIKAAAAQSAFMRKNIADLDQAHQDAQTHAAIQQEEIQKQQTKIDDALNTKIDPSRYFSSRTTAQTIATGIGLFLGAFGKNGNSAVKVIDDAINRDIDAQKMDMAKNVKVQDSALSMMRDKFSNQNQADAATKAFLYDKAQMQVQSIAAQTQNVMAKANAESLYGQLEIKKQEAKMEALKAVRASGVFGDVSGDTAKVLNASRALGIKTEDALEDYSKYQHHEESVKKMSSDFMQAANLRTMSNYISSPVQSLRQADAIEAGMIPTLGEAYKRFTESEKETFHKNMPAAGDSKDTTQLKLKVIENLVSSKEPEYKTGLISTLGIKRKPLATLGAAK